MQNKRNIIIIGIGIAVTLLLFYLLFSNVDRIKLHNWEETYYCDSQEPYGTYVLVELLEDYFEQEELKIIKKEEGIAELLAEKVESGKLHNYVFVGTQLRMDSVDLEGLFDFVLNGNNAFISTRNYPLEIKELFAEEEVCDWFDHHNRIPNETTELNFFHKDLRIKKDIPISYKRNYSLDHYVWRSYDQDCFWESTGTEMLGVADSNEVNFIRFPYGEGTFYLHLTPLAFTNHSLLDKSALEYAERAFSHLGTGDIIWDEYSKYDPAYQSASDNSMFAKSPLTYILSQPSLKWAWYLLLALALLYLIFRAKRQQRIIPIIEPVENTSLEYVKTIGSLYFQQHNHRKLAKHKMNLLLGFIRDRYYMSTNNVDEDWVKRLAVKSQVPINDLKNIFDHYQDIYDKDKLSEDGLVRFHKAIAQFYKKAK